MTLQDILKSLDFKVGDIKTRISTGSISLNGDIVEDIRLDIGSVSEVRSAGCFLKLLNENIDFDRFKMLLSITGFDSLMSGESNIKNPLTDFLKDWSIIRTGKTEVIFVRSGDPSDIGVLFDMEGEKSQFKKVEVTKKFTIDVEKIKIDIEKINKQLSNPGFMKNAPEFKIQQAMKRKQDLEKKLKLFQ